MGAVSAAQISRGPPRSICCLADRRALAQHAHAETAWASGTSTTMTVKLVAAVGMLCLVLLAPLLLVDVPPLLDYPNHLARAVFLAFGASDPLMSQYYAAHWAIIPDLGTDLVW